MWTKEHRKTCERVGGRYPSYMTDGEWARLEPLIPAAKPGGRPRKTIMREAVDAILYLCARAARGVIFLATDFPPRSTVYNIFRKFQRDGVCRQPDRIVSAAWPARILRSVRHCAMQRRLRSGCTTPWRRSPSRRRRGRCL
nr:transposase [Methylocapsa palsarum]